MLCVVVFMSWGVMCCGIHGLGYYVLWYSSAGVLCAVVFMGWGVMCCGIHGLGYYVLWYSSAGVLCVVVFMGWGVIRIRIRIILFRKHIMLVI